MTEITRVPIKPIAKGSVAKLWLGIAAALLLAGTLAWAGRARGVEVEVVAEGTGASPTKDDVVFVRYTGTLPDGKVFDKSQDIPLPVQGLLPAGSPLPLANMIPGFTEAALQMKKGGRYSVTIPADKGYGAEGRRDQQGTEVIPPGADLTFDVEMIDFMSRAEFEQRIQVLQQAMQMQQGQGTPAPAPAPE
ncbi:FKBP-type peptidyl-prolyl cis-trans isomerase [Qipengyuania sediminis]|uniref:FKBP-type peptidyl-prolyl cis-trans isomerase n=1 Tax=Qipengyuania sediminis TaxID=1532023 RepID=UPI001059AE1B|nr:FKBP-type peptidyl-prolyl cis-trans isomerase [Qipengyuania sediminis]